MATQLIFDTIPDGNDPQNPVRIYTDGCYDCFHFGHANVIKQCKEFFKYTYIVVGVCSDEDTVENKGKNLMNQEERAECVRHCKWADEVHIEQYNLFNLYSQYNLYNLI